MNVHSTLMLRLKAFEARLESTNFIFDESPENTLQVQIIVAFNQFEKDKNKRQVQQKMKARIEKGYWPFCLSFCIQAIWNTLNGKYPV